MLHMLGRRTHVGSAGRRAGRGRLVPVLDSLEARQLMSRVSINAGSTGGRHVPDHFLGVSLTGSDTYLVDGLDPTVRTPDRRTIALLNQVKFGTLRLSNGNEADLTHFDRNPEPGDDNVVGAGVLARITKSARADGLVNVNYGTGTPQEAAAYLSYLNGKIGDRTPIGLDHNGKDWHSVAFWAKIRSEAPRDNGDNLDFLRIQRSKPFGFTRFEVGNEVYFGQWEANAHATPRQYVAFAKTFASLASRIDPNARIGLDVTSPTSSFRPYWNGNLLQACRKLGFTPGFLSDHFYVFDSNGGKALDDRSLLGATVGPPGVADPLQDGPINWQDRARAFRKLLADNLPGSANRVELIAGEFNSDAASSSTAIRGTRQGSNLVHGLFIADSIGAALQTSYQSVSYWNLRNFYDATPADGPYYGWRQGFDYGLLGTTSSTVPDAMKATGPYKPYPSFYAMMLVSKFAKAGDLVVPTSSDSPDLSVYAIRRHSGRLALLVINKSPTKAIDETFVVSGFTPSGRLNLDQYGKKQDNQQRFEMQDGREPALLQIDQGFSVDSTRRGSRFHLTFPAYSMSLLVLDPRA
ncbi:hypothetical protein P12x_005532 [Tundrisphaera lichenicola]|uniref:hypothetical protein n=1 Tax=Tundrisphaera lichenicola TaxID=2029860 RepID=UPI003EBF083F